MKPRIAEIRRSKGLTQKHVALQLEISYQRLSDWERKIAYPRVDKLKRIADVLEVKWFELYEEE